ncbi:hypothetical protein N7471_002216 [Penicillium samsonianum]|uniref:uncharacterized protein n=1 Tax=Penicillium samsonianum TaxID=1882272 RepID=UPI00254995D6|nr:uncharacterized protein N7471_002216 [Penicillium samsonianum]KAJ6142763.1 hypothetical protein N7471_002216 [Penicillium samsonianum]
MMSLFEEDQPEPPPQPKTGWQEELKGYLNTEAISEGEDGDNSDEAGEIVTDQEAAEESDDDSALHPLPAIDTISQARPQRDRKRRRDEDLYEYTR